MKWLAAYGVLVLLTLFATLRMVENNSHHDLSPAEVILKMQRHDYASRK